MIEKVGWGAPWAWSDVIGRHGRHRAGVELYGETDRRKRQRSNDRRIAHSHYPMAASDPSSTPAYFETFNRGRRFTLVDLRQDPIVPYHSDRCADRERAFDVDVIVFATGFDAMTGALNRIDIRGATAHVRDEWTTPQHLARSAGRRISEFVHHHRPGEPVRTHQHGDGDRASRRWIAEFA